MDLDHFKEINDTLGHHVGDELLRLVSARLRAAVREGDTVARFGGDEFAVLCPALTDVSVAEELAQRLVDALAEPFGLEQISLHVGASVGIALLPLHADEVDQLVQRADIALYQAKAERGSTRRTTRSTTSTRWSDWRSWRSCVRACTPNWCCTTSRSARPRTAP